MAQNAGKPWSLTEDAQGNAVFQVRAGDVAGGDGPTKERSELTHPDKQPFDTDVWVSAPFLIDPGPLSSAPWCVLGQFHQSEDDGEAGLSPVFEQQYIGGHLRFYARGGAGTSMAATTTTLTCEMPVERGAWLHVVHRIRFSRGGLGHVRSWLNGAQVHDSDVRIGYDDRVGPYWKHGIYRAASPETLTVRYGTVEVGTTSLAARITRT